MGKASLTGRLTLLFMLVSSGILLALGVVIAASVEKHFEEQDMELLTGKMELVSHTLEKIGATKNLDAVMQSLDNSLIGHHGLDVMVIGADNSIVFSNSAQPFSIAEINTSALKNPLKPAIWTRNGQSYRGIAARVDTGLSDNAPVIVAVAIDVAHHQEFMQSFQRTLWAFIAGAAALAGFLGWIAVRRGLVPLRSMRDQTNAVTAQHLSYRLPVETMPIELTDLAKSLNDMLARLEDAFARLTAFSSDIAHELRTPVSNLMTETQVALSRPRSSEEYQRILESNAEEFDHLGRMISDMLLLAKADNGLVIPHLENLQLATEVGALFDYYDAVADEKGVSFAVSGDAEISADRLMFRRALGNLLSNAIRHATPRSCVRVLIQELPETTRIEVENVGEVIPGELLDRVFERFFRVDPSRQNLSEGTGLGLAITKSIVAAHRGTIAATSADKKTTFAICLPRTASTDA